MNDEFGQAKHRLTIGLDREPPVVEPLIADQWVVKSLLQKSIRRGEVEIAQRAALTFLGAKRLCALATLHHHCVRGRRGWLRRRCCHDRCREHGCKLAETIGRRRYSCLPSGSFIGRSTKEPFCRAPDNEFRSTPVIGTREAAGQHQLDCGQSGRRRGQIQQPYASCSRSLVRLGHRLETREGAGKRFARAPRHISATWCARGVGRGNRYRRHEVP